MISQSVMVIGMMPPLWTLLRKMQCLLVRTSTLTPFLPTAMRCSKKRDQIAAAAAAGEYTIMDIAALFTTLVWNGLHFD